MAGTGERDARLERFRNAFAAGWKLLREGRHDRVAAVFTEDVTYVDHRLGDAPIVHGREGLQAMWGPLFGRFEVHGEVLDVPARDVVLTCERYVPRAGGAPVVTYGLYTIEYGRIARGEFFAHEHEARSAVSAHAAS